VIGKQLLKPDLAIAGQFRTDRVDDHAGLDRCLAGLDVALAVWAKLDHAQAAVAVGPVQPDIITQVRDGDVFLKQGLQNGEIVVDFDFTTIDRDLDPLVV